MAKRQQQNLDEGVNMDSMMDNMTNVVGTLLLVLMIVQMQVNNKAGEIEESFANVTQDDLDKAKKRA